MSSKEKSTQSDQKKQGSPASGQQDIETVTPATETIVPDTPATKKEDTEDKKANSAGKKKIKN